MPDYNSYEWQLGKNKTAIAVENRHQIEIRVSCTQDVQVLGVRGSEEIPIKIGRDFRFKAKTEGFEKLVLKGKPSTEYGYSVREISRQDAEALNDDNPPAPPMPGANNLIAQMRRIAAEEARANRTPVLEPEDLPFGDKYVIEEDDYDFEEEIFASRQKEEEDKRRDAADPPPADPPAAPEAHPPEDEPTIPAQAAE